jgi:hypothetical protein
MTVYSREEVANRGLHWREVSPMMYTTITNGRAPYREQSFLPTPP